MERRNDDVSERSLVNLRERSLRHVAENHEISGGMRKRIGMSKSSNGAARDPLADLLLVVLLLLVSNVT
jgi:ABC-type proline/glycine betaine transport system ATPase subunit